MVLVVLFLSAHNCCLDHCDKKELLCSFVVDPVGLVMCSLKNSKVRGKKDEGNRGPKLFVQWCGKLMQAKET